MPLDVKCILHFILQVILFAFVVWLHVKCFVWIEIIVRTNYAECSERTSEREKKIIKLFSCSYVKQQKKENFFKCFVAFCVFNRRSKHEEEKSVRIELHLKICYSNLKNLFTSFVSILHSFLLIFLAAESTFVIGFLCVRFHFPQAEKSKPRTNILIGKW